MRADVSEERNVCQSMGVSDQNWQIYGKIWNGYRRDRRNNCENSGAIAYGRAGGEFGPTNGFDKNREEFKICNDYYQTSGTK
jgi:hypothetical protein